MRDRHQWPDAESLCSTTSHRCGRSPPTSSWLWHIPQMGQDLRQLRRIRRQRAIHKVDPRELQRRTVPERLLRRHRPNFQFHPYQSNISYVCIFWYWHVWHSRIYCAIGSRPRQIMGQGRNQAMEKVFLGQDAQQDAEDALARHCNLRSPHREHSHKRQCWYPTRRCWISSQYDCGIHEGHLVCHIQGPSLLTVKIPFTPRY